MTESELQAELTKANNELGTKQKELNAIQDGSNTELKSLEENKEKAYEDYQEQLKLVDEELAEKVDTLKQDIDTKDQAINEKDQAITSQESSVANAETAYTNAQTNTQALEGRLSELQSKEGSEQDSAKKSKLSSLISGLKS